MGVSKGLRQFYDTAILSSTDECIIWPYGRNHRGYAEFQQGDGRSKIAHHRICEAVNGPPPTPDHVASHSCLRGFDGCINPKHLSWKTTAQNVQESLHIREGKYRRLTQAEVDEIRRRYVPKVYGYMRIAKEMQIDSETVRNVANGKTYK